MNLLQNWRNLARLTANELVRRALNIPPWGAPAPIGAVGGNYSLIGASSVYGSSLAYSAAWACVQVLTQDLAKLRFQLWQGSDEDGWKPARRHFLYPILRRPNQWMSRYELIRYQVLSLLTDGNSYNLILRNRDLDPVALLPIHPRYVQIYQAYDGELIYEIRSTMAPALEAALLGRPRRVPQRDILHIRHLSMDGVIGMSPIGAAQLAINYGMNLERQGAALSSRGGKPGGILKTTARLTNDAAKRLREEWDAAYNGNGEGIGRTAVLEEGLSFEPLAFRAVDAQFLESRKFQAEEVARMFRVKPYKIGIMDKLSYNNVEHMQKDHVDSTLQPMAELIEQSYAFTFNLSERYSVEFDFEDMLRADTQGRFRKYATGIQWGILSPNDARRQEGLDPYEGGDVYLRPVNMAPADEAARQAIDDDDDGAGLEEQEEEEQEV